MYIYNNYIDSAFISIFPNQFKAPQGCKLRNLLPMDVTKSANHYPTIKQGNDENLRSFFRKLLCLLRGDGDRL